MCRLCDRPFGLLNIQADELEVEEAVHRTIRELLVCFFPHAIFPKIPARAATRHTPKTFSGAQSVESP